jgi:hypothetical protein
MPLSASFRKNKLPSKPIAARDSRKPFGKPGKVYIPLKNEAVVRKNRHTFQPETVANYDGSFRKNQPTFRIAFMPLSASFREDESFSKPVVASVFRKPFGKSGKT